MIRKAVRDLWAALGLGMKIVFGLCALTFAFVLIHGTITYRANHQTAFGISVARKIDIPNIRVRTKHDVLILEGVATRAQSDYAVKMADYMIKKYSREATNPPTSVSNKIEIRLHLDQGQPVKQAIARAGSNSES